MESKETKGVQISNIGHILEYGAGVCMHTRRERVLLQFRRRDRLLSGCGVLPMSSDWPSRVHATRVVMFHNGGVRGSVMNDTF